MGIKKSTLRNHFEAKFSEREMAIKKHRNEATELHLEPYLKEVYPEITEIAEKARVLHDMVEKVADHYQITSWDLRNSYLRDLNYLLDIRTKYVRSLTTGIMKFLTGESDNIAHDPAISNQFLDALRKLRKFYQDETSKIENLKTLLIEVRTVINNAGSGNKAMKDLEALGLSLEGLEQTQVKENLPVIQKFSVDVCLLEDTCKEEEAK